MDLRVKQKAKQVIAAGFMLGLPGELEFNPDRPYAGCLLCGAVFQSKLDLRVPPGHEPHNSLIAKLAKEKRDEWRYKHFNNEHTAREREIHIMSGRFAMPEAAQALSQRGIFSIVDMVIDDEVSNALAEASPIPQDETRTD